MRRLLPILALPAALLAGCTATATPASPATTTTSPAATSSATTGPATTGPTVATTVAPTGNGTPRCHTGDLGATSAYGDGAAGHFSVDLRLTNKSGHTCTVLGFPGVSWVAGDNGKQVNDPFKRVTAVKKTITLKPGATAHSMLVQSQTAFFDEKTCKPVQVRGYRVYPPDETAAIFVRSPQKVCSAKGIGLGEVYPITGGAGQSAG
jgi:Protein of unknown function (DUF4232)